jgi:tetratricopeptide (TPR) repeat protein
MVEPGNAIWKGFAAGTRIEFSRVLLNAGRLGEAAQQTNASCEIAASIRPVSSAVGRRSGCLVMRARIALQSGAYADALASAEQALPLAKQARSDDPRRDQSQLAAVYRIIGDARRGMHDQAGAKAAWLSAFDAFPADVALWPSEMDERAIILQRLGRAAEAQQIAARLKSMGYHRAS